MINPTAYYRISTHSVSDHHCSCWSHEIKARQAAHWTTQDILQQIAGFYFEMSEWENTLINILN
jgi:hypothetical protein